MGLTRSLVSGSSSMRAHQKMLDVISNNIANINTSGYKSSRANFADEFYQIYRYGKAPDKVPENGLGGVNPMQFGLGVKVGSITKDMSQGIIETTNRPLDLALQGEGFFVVHQNGQELYTRAGAFTRDEDGNIVDSTTGANVQGYNINIDSAGKIVKDINGENTLDSKYTNLTIPSDMISPPRQSQNITISGNLNSANPSGYERKTSINVFDNNGGVHSLTLDFVKTDNANEFSVSAQIDGVDVNLSDTTVQFNADGTLKTPMNVSIAASDLNSALSTTSFDETSPKDLNIQFGDANNLSSGSLTNFGGTNTLTFKSQDGYQSGDLLNLNVDDTGKVWGAFSNGQSEILGQVVVAKFTNTNGLMQKGMNYYSVGPNSGIPVIGTALESFGSTKMTSKAIEQSNVDLTTEFTKMITTQRAFEAASRIILTSDQMISQLNIIKR